MRLAVNVVAFYAAWFACALGATYGWPWLGAVLAVAVTVLHLALAGDWRPEFFVVLGCALTGVIVESFVIQAGVVRYHSPVPYAGAAPAWIVAMWLAFGTLMNVSFAWLKSRLVMAAGLGLLLAPLSYIAGEKLGALNIIGDYYLSLAVIGVLWAIALPLMLLISRRYDGITGYRTR